MAKPCTLGGKTSLVPNYTGSSYVAHHVYHGSISALVSRHVTSHYTCSQTLIINPHIHDEIEAASTIHTSGLWVRATCLLSAEPAHHHTTQYQPQGIGPKWLQHYRL